MTAALAGRRWWKIAWYPLAVPVSFVILIWSATDIHPIWLVRPLAVAAAVVLLLTVAFSALLQDRDRGALAASAVVVALVVNDFRLAALLAVIAWLIVAEGVMNWRRPWARGPVVTRGLTVTCAALLAVTLLGAVQGGSIGQAIDDVAADLAETPAARTFDPNAPDMYVVLLDGYPGDDALELDPSFDGDAFANALTARAFDVQRHTRSNYLLTRLTVATMFGGDHIASSQDLRPPFLGNADDARRLRRFGDDGPIYRALREAGYETATIAADASHLGLHRVDHVVEAPGVNEFEGVLLHASTAGMLLERYFHSQLLDMRRASVLTAFAAAETSGPSGERPFFEWVHLMAPHPPLAFDADGRPVDDIPALTWQEPTAGEAGRAARIRRTFEYVKFVDNRTLALVDRLIERDPQSVIVVMSDHGTDTAFNAQDPLASDLNERTSALLAVRSPGHPGLLPPGTTPINVLPRVLNAYLGTSLPIRSDTTWAWPAGGSVLDVIQVDMKAIAR